MCRNIRRLFNLEPTATEAEIRDAATQYVRKIAGTTKPSKANETAFDDAIDEITTSTATLIDTLMTQAPPRTRDEEKQRALKRYEQRGASTG